MHNHGYHSHCHHEQLSYCPHCDVVYCEKCGREWVARKVIEYRYKPYIWEFHGIPYRATYSGGDWVLTTSNGTAVTNKDVYTAFYSSNQSASGDENKTWAKHSHTHNTVK